MSTPSTPNDSPAPILPMHNPSQAAHVLGNATNGAVSGLGVKALLAKKMAKNNNPKFISPTDNLMTPVTQKLNAAKQKHFTKGVKPMGNLFSKESQSSDEQGSKSDAEPSDHLDSSETKTTNVQQDDEEENPF
ncbi:hypothetical protein ID866_2479 [Astraeus odoratus]|nr:hypothetical protein ID866_2479 [Astraeus odoratus]